MNIIVFASALHDVASVLGRREEALRSFAGEDITLYNCDADLSTVANPVCFIATGGTEELFARIWDKLPRPVVLLSDGYHNSLAAAFEIASFLQQKGVEHKLINLPLEGGSALFGQVAESADAPAFASPYDCPAVMEALGGSRIGLIGGASSWLISSGIDQAAVAARYGAEFIDINIRELEEEYRATASEPGQDTAATYSREALADAERMYRALKAICGKYRLTALTVKCFDLLDSCRTTSCLALARLSDEGIISGCEGDIPSLWSLIVAHALTGRPAFMANPSSSNPADATVDFAHCTIPISMTSSYTLPSHFESGIGIGIAGILAEGPCKILKIGGPLLDKVFQAEGSIVCNTRIPERCRTQIRFQFPSRAEFARFMSNRLGNHIVLYR
ncbi:MAG: fucose isomerase [Bacteroidales bacterium]|nr:fucose isomerase [Bacteroidales bacterium]MBQ9529043.1 fucose isomerase [Bacteroidales bacterium]